MRTTRNEYRTESQREDFFSNLERVVDAAEFTRDGDRLARVLVPLGPQPMISPVFASSYGGVYLYGLGPTARYGAYVYAAPTEIALPARAVCRFAWRNAPFALPVVSNPTLEACGPTPQRGTPPG